MVDGEGGDAVCERGEREGGRADGWMGQLPFHRRRLPLQSGQSRQDRCGGCFPEREDKKLRSYV